MAFTGGPLSMVGIVPSYTSNLGQQTSSSGVVEAQNQVWQGAGQAFSGKPGQPLTGALTGSPVNVALNSDSFSGFGGLRTGNNVEAPALAPYLSSTQAFGMNGQIGKSLGRAGAFGSLLSIGGSAATRSLGGAGSAVGSVLSSLVGAANYIMFPGAGGEGASNFAGIPYTLTDVTFSLQPANKGPQSYGSSSGTTFPKSMTTLPFNEYTSMPQLAGSPTSNALKSSAMVGGLSQKAFSPSLSSTNFNTSIPKLV